MDWFSAKGVKAGDPMSLIEFDRDQHKKTVHKQLQADCGTVNKSCGLM